MLIFVIRVYYYFKVGFVLEVVLLNFFFFVDFGCVLNLVLIGEVGEVFL